MESEKKYSVAVAAKAFYVEDQSDADKNHYVFGYTIRVTNTGTVAAKLVSRHWVITDSNHRVEEVRGLGVIGQQPTLEPGQSFEYTSGCPLATPVGTMRGEFEMVGVDGHKFEARIPEFTLSVPRVLH
jgi:ApaG protein